MDFYKQYILQSITAASSNLRLNNQRIEAVAIIKEVILKSKDLQHALNQMKKITELSKFAIKLSEIHHYLSEGNIDFMKLSDKFKEQSFNLIRELNQMLDHVEPSSLKQKLSHIIETEIEAADNLVDEETPANKQIKGEMGTIDMHILRDKENMQKSSEPNKIITEVSALEHNAKFYQTNEEQKDGDAAFKSFESIILKPIKSIDELLNHFAIDSEIPPEIEEYSKQMIANSELSFKNGFEILAQMHEILAKGLMHIKNKTLIPSKEVIESLRACLIVIVAVVKSKEVDIRNYHNRAEVFGKFLNKIKIEES